ncbi:2,4-dienoyl-CoA reductase-like NADH-dependent reductase (Old Yellow Enzyme family) [Sphingobium sp. B2D3A]|nr:2,4-dienoyl-CoA reductase-like NADH-dependent reductase (Old Yellow Enzyme family) [Sphingobium sp. B2D3A]MCW2385894.1 2,4-dienoyl-CoA reductase-like NADH-dependent reductase (Old Yellow Enzyme family) [Sphingobium sp. B2D3D]
MAMTVLRSIELFLRRTGMAATRFGRECVRDPRFVHDLRRGREPSERTRRRVEHFMNIYEKGAQ